MKNDKQKSNARKKLELNKQTTRLLDNNEIRAALGAAPTAACSQFPPC